MYTESTSLGTFSKSYNLSKIAAKIHNLTLYILIANNTGLWGSGELFLRNLNLCIMVAFIIS